jgi:hypothetical protein
MKGKSESLLLALCAVNVICIQCFWPTDVRLQVADHMLNESEGGLKHGTGMVPHGETRAHHNNSGFWPLFVKLLDIYSTKIIVKAARTKLSDNDQIPCSSCERIAPAKEAGSYEIYVSRGEKKKGIPPHRSRNHQFNLQSTHNNVKVSMHMYMMAKAQSQQHSTSHFFDWWCIVGQLQL